jgi:PPOX class probable F420-dependent enzyme
VPRPPLPQEFDQFLTRPNPAVIATIRPDGEPHTVATWYDWEDGRVLVNMDRSRRRLEYVRANRSVALTVLDERDWYRHVSLLGRVVSLEEDADLRDIDRLSRRYRQRPYPARDSTRFSAWIEVERWHAWGWS